MLTRSGLPTEETIAAIASAPGASPRGILRISGIHTLTLLHDVLRSCPDRPELDHRIPRRYVCHLPLETRGSQLPLAVYVWPLSRSYTGEPAAEIHTLGAPPFLNWLLQRLYAAGARPARPGEFTLRGFLAGKLSLVQAEAVLGVIEAQGEHQLDVALSQLAGGISRRMRTMRDQLLDDLADLEAGLDFVEEDLEFIDRDEFQTRLRRFVLELDLLRESALDRMVNTSDIRIVLAGLPNAGKSSLFNRLAEQHALVADLAGTTTDYLIGQTTLAGQRVEFYDTAGWETGLDEIGRQAQRFRDQEYQRADLILWCTPMGLNQRERDIDEQAWEQLQASSLPCWRIQTKVDRAEKRAGDPLGQGETTRFRCGVSVQAERGLEDLKHALEMLLRDNQTRSWEILGTTAARCRDSIERTGEHLKLASALADRYAGEELIAEELRGAIQELGVILGQVYTDDLLDRVFSKFCIGK